MPSRILHVDDDPDIREIVGLLLRIDPALTVQSCADGDSALELAANWLPDLILCDAMMPVMDGPAVLRRLRACEGTTNIPVVFMTARAKTLEISNLMSLGAAGIILKPFDPMTLVDSVKRYLNPIGLETMKDGFSARLLADRAMLGEFQRALANDPLSLTVLEEMQSCAHKLAGASGVYGFQAVSLAASRLEVSLSERRDDSGTSTAVESDLEMLLDCIGRAQSRTPHVVLLNGSAGASEAP